MQGFHIETTPFEIVVHIERSADANALEALQNELRSYFQPNAQHHQAKRAESTNDWIHELETVSIPTLAMVRIDRAFLYDDKERDQRLDGNGDA